MVRWVGDVVEVGSSLEHYIILGGGGGGSIGKVLTYTF